VNDAEKARLIASVDVSRAVWRRGSTASAERSVEIAFVDDAILMRDGKNPDGPVLFFTRAEWDAFVGGAKDGEFDLS
jgi:hypothetical protein